MGSRDAEHTQWNLDRGLKPNEHLPLVCPRCARPHVETLTSDPSQPDYYHHVHQCSDCGLRFELYVRCRSIVVMPSSLRRGDRIEWGPIAFRRTGIVTTVTPNRTDVQPDGGGAAQWLYDETTVDRGDRIRVLSKASV